MIMRIFEVVTRPGKEEAFGRFFHDTAIPLMRGTKGIVSVLPGAARPESPERVQLRDGLGGPRVPEGLRRRGLREPPYRSVGGGVGRVAVDPAL